MNFEACLPEDLRKSTPTLTPIAAGLSGAGVYRVEAAGQVFVLKVSVEGEQLDDWRRKLNVLRLAANAGLAPAVIHVDEGRRAVLSAFVVDRSFPAFYRDPRTHQTALAQLGRTVRRVHELPLPPEVTSKDPHAFLAALWTGLGATSTLPAFVGDAIRRVLNEEAPVRDRPGVLSHNDANPTNLVYDGERLLFLDWETAGANDPFFDLAVLSVFLRMDEGTCLKLLAAYDGEAPARIPPRFAYHRRLAAVLPGTYFLQRALQSGHPGTTGGETLASAPSLADVYQRVRDGTLNVATGEGQWRFGLALIKASADL